MKRTFSEIAHEIESKWLKVPISAKPYLDALKTIHSTSPVAEFLFDDAKTIALYFLNNAGGFKGDDAKRLKEELKSMLA